MLRGRLCVTALLACLAGARAATAWSDMAQSMQMEDDARFGKIMLDQLEWRGAAGAAAAAWDAQAWYGGDLDKFWLRAEGLAQRGNDADTSEANLELLWNRVIGRWWGLQAGGREDLGTGPARTWAAVGVQGIAPQWIETEATLYASADRRTAARLKLQYDLLLTQRLILQPFVEANLYGRDDPQRQIGAGLSDLQVSVRLRFEVVRQFAPYIGMVWLQRFGQTAALARAAGQDCGTLQLAAGLRAWF
ncbi:MAG TPA: copper resistance protein B [Steroidobacteraceae bacterium]